MTQNTFKLKTDIETGKKVSFKISIGICTSNDENTINYLLGTLTKLFSRPFNIFQYEITFSEIIIVSSGCVDATEKIILKYKENFPNNLKLIIESKRSGKSNAINKILNKFLGDSLIMIPADVIFPTKSIIFLVSKLLSRERIGVVSGSPIILHNSHKCNTICKTINLIWKFHNHSLSQKQNNHATGELMIIRRNIIHELPPNIINDDAYISLEAYSNNWDIEYEKNAVVYISVPKNLKNYLIQRKRIIIGHKQLVKLKNNETSTLRSIFKKDKILFLKLIFRELRYPENWYYFTLAVILEFIIEIQLKFSKQDLTINESIWKRIKSMDIGY